MNSSFSPLLALAGSTELALSASRMVVRHPVTRSAASRRICSSGLPSTAIPSRNCMTVRLTRKGVPILQRATASLSSPAIPSRSERWAGAMSRLCCTEFLSFSAVRKWTSVVSQSVKIGRNSPSCFFRSSPRSRNSAYAKGTS